MIEEKNFKGIKFLLIFNKKKSESIRIICNYISKTYEEQNFYYYLKSIFTSKDSCTVKYKKHKKELKIRSDILNNILFLRYIRRNKIKK